MDTRKMKLTMESKLLSESKKEQKIQIADSSHVSKEIESEIYASLNSSPIPEVSRDSIVIRSPHDNNTQDQAIRILNEFNKNVKTDESCFTDSVFRGYQIDPGKFWLGVRNTTPELHGESGIPIARTLLPFHIGQFTKIVRDDINQSDSFYGMNGSYVLNVPSGHYAKANSGNKQLIFGEGCHVIHDANFSFKPNTSIVDQNSDYIEHGTIHILRVPAGKICKIWVGSEAFILTGRKEPYVFNSPLLKVVKNTPENSLYFDQNTNYIEHGTTHILRIPVGKLAKIWIGQEARILLGRNEPYVFHEPQFQLVKNKTDNSWYFDQNTDYIEHGTTHILRIPVGKLAKIWIGQEAKILPGQNEPYTFHEPQFQLIKKDNNSLWFDQSDQYINHGTTHILRIPTGKFAKVWIGQEAKLLQANTEPYIFHDAQFQLIKKENNNLWFDQSDLFIHHGNKTFLRIPAGQYAKIWIGSKAQILFSQAEPYEFDTPLFRLDDQNGNWLKNQTDSYIKHGTQHIIRVPDGKIAKAWVGSEARLLEASKEPYQFDDPLFRLEENPDRSMNSIFFDATSRLIQHGSIKRVIPKSNEVAITFENGTLKILRPLEDKKPHMITSPTHEVSGFLDTSIKTLVFPSEEEMKKGMAEKLPADEVNLVRFTTRDSLKIGVKILVAFSIIDPEKALLKLKDIESILIHIENIAKVDMGMAIQQCSSQEILFAYQTKPENNKLDPSVKTYQDRVRDQVAKDLEEYGIELIRLNIETPKILNEKIANEMEQASVDTAKANAKESVLEQNYRIAQRNAQQTAETKRIEMEQVNNAKVAQAQADLDTEKLKAEAKIVQTEAENKAILMRAETEQKATLMKADAEAKAITMKSEAEKTGLDLRGQAYRDYPGLLELHKLNTQVDTLKGVSFNVTSSEFAQLRNSFGIFSAPSSLLPGQPRQLTAQETAINIMESTKNGPR